MKLELKNVKIMPRMSEETTCFCATLYVDGKKAADCSNTGKGGMTDVRFYNTKVHDEVIKYCNENPVVNTFKGKTYTFHEVDARVDELLIEYEMKKILNKRQKDALVLHSNKEKDPQYIVHSYLKFKKPIDEMIKDEAGRLCLKIQIEHQRKCGFTVMNTNIDYKGLGV